MTSSTGKSPSPISSNWSLSLESLICTCFTYAPRFVIVSAGVSPKSLYGWCTSQRTAIWSLANLSRSSRSFFVDEKSPHVLINMVTPLSSAEGMSFFRFVSASAIRSSTSSSPPHDAHTAMYGERMSAQSFISDLMSFITSSSAPAMSRALSKQGIVRSCSRSVLYDEATEYIWKGPPLSVRSLFAVT